MSTENEMTVSERSPSERTELEHLVATVVEAAGLWAEEVNVTGSAGSRILTVVVDSTSGTDGVGMDALGTITQAISQQLDAAGDHVPGIGTSAYQLEVTSPGVFRSLTRPHHWVRNIGRVVEVTIGGDDEAVLARILQVDDEGVELAEVRPGAKKGMPAKESAGKHHRFDVLSPATVQVEWSHG